MSATPPFMFLGLIRQNFFNIRLINQLPIMEYLAYGYALTVATGGVIGFVKAGSFVSLVMGLLFGGLSAYGAFLMSKDPRNFWLLFLCSALLGGIMGYRAMNSGKFMPAGLVAALSLLMFVSLLPRVFK